MKDSPHLPCHLHTQDEADELAKLIVKAARAKIDVKPGTRVTTPYQRKYKKSYNATWEVSQNSYLILAEIKSYLMCSINFLSQATIIDILTKLKNLQIAHS